MPTNSFPLVRGRTMRVTALDGCCSPAYGPDNQSVSDGFVSVALTANINEPEEIVITNANGATCVRDAGCPEFQGYNVEITFCQVTPCLFSLVTGQPVVLDGEGNAIGFRMNSKVRVCDSGFALEVWMGVPGVACSGEGGAFGYLLLPCLQAGVIGDFTIENAAITFTVTGAVTRDGNGWGTGPYDVVDDGGVAGPLNDPLDVDDHLLAIFTTVPPPEVTDGCVELVPQGTAATGATAGTPGTWTPSGADRPANAAAATTVVASPTTAWTAGQYVQGSTAGAPGEMYWDGAAWVAGRAAVVGTQSAGEEAATQSARK